MAAIQHQSPHERMPSLTTGRDDGLGESGRAGKGFGRDEETPGFRSRRVDVQGISKREGMQDLRDDDKGVVLSWHVHLFVQSRVDSR
jgi:hypothetical protein